MSSSRLTGRVALFIRFLTACLSFTAVILPVCADTDFNLNGMSDIWELKYNASGLSTNADTDGDGQNNLAESIAGTDPFNAGSVLKFASVNQSGGNVTLTWASLVGKRYQVQSCTNLTQATWINEGSLLAGNGGLLVATPPVNASPEFFHVVVTDTDTDGDGVPDWDELQVGFDPNKSSTRGDGTDDHTAIQNALASPNVVSVQAMNPYASMDGPVTGSVQIARSGNLNAVTVNFATSGTATAGVDYVALPSSVTLPLGVNSAIVAVTPLSNATALVSKLVTLIVQSNAAYTVSSSNKADVVIDPLSTPFGTGLLGQYYDNANATYTNATNFTGLKVTRVDPTINFNWGIGQPYTTVTQNMFSARWDGILVPTTNGTYTFDLQADDGARLYLTNQVIIDAWAAGSSTTNPLQSPPVTLIAGSNYPVRVEYYELTNSAMIHLRWQTPVSSSFVSIPSANVLHPTLATNRWAASYFNNTNLTGTAVSTNLETAVFYDWGAGSPDPSIGLDTFSIRWTGQVQPEHTEPYSFFVNSNDGVKLWVDGQLIIDRWTNATLVTTGTVSLVGGVRYDIKYEYFENSNYASNTLYWWSPSQTKQVIPTERLYPNTNAAANVTSPATVIGLVGGPFNFQVTGSNLPLNFGATGLPPGLSFNVATGQITGTPTTAGTYNVVLSTTNGRGTGYNVLQLVILNTGGNIVREYWNGVTGNSVTNVPVGSTPSGSNTLTSLQGPTSFGTNYGARVRGWFTPQVSGNYRFWISSDGPSELWISDDNEPVMKVKRCSVTNTTATLNWTTESNQRSPMLRLTAGHPYYVEILYLEKGGADHLEVGWRKPGESDAAPSEIVPGYALSPYAPPTVQSGQETLYVATLTPQGNALSSGSGVATLRMAADELSATITVTYGNLSSAFTGMHVHDATTGGSIMFDFDDATPTNGVYYWTFTPTGNLTVQDIVNSIKSGNAYVNVHTAQYPAGEIKGFYQLSAGSQTFTPPAPPPTLPGGLPTASDAARFLTQATFGPASNDIALVQASGFDTWLNQQFAATPTLFLPQIYSYYVANPTAGTNGTPVYQAWWRTAVTAPDQLRQRVAFALSEIFVVSIASSDLDDQPWGVASYYDMLVNDAFGNFRQMLQDVTLHPAMGLYLDMLKNDKPDAASGRNPNENYAREINQLFSLGLQNLFPDGTLKLSSQGLPLATYDQNVIVGFAHTFTGWSYYSTNGNFNAARNLTNTMTIAESRHDNTNEKLLLDNVVLPVGQTGTQDMQNALDNIFNHQNVGPFICRRLIQRLVTSNPSPGYIYRVASVFNDNGTGVRGDMQAVVRAILLDYEARSTTNLNSQGYGHLREPVARTTHVIRALHGFSNSGNWSMNNTDSYLAQTPLDAATVFNFFEPDYVQPGEIAAAGLYAPEFQITSETTVIQYDNLMTNGVYKSDGVPGNGSRGFQNDVELNLTNETVLATSPSGLADYLGQILLSSNMSAALRTEIINRLNTMPSASNTDKLNRARAAVYLVITSPEFVTQR